MLTKYKAITTDQTYNIFTLPEDYYFSLARN